MDLFHFKSLKVITCVSCPENLNLVTQLQFYSTTICISWKLLFYFYR